MKLVWTSKGLEDVGRLRDFLAPVNERAAIKLVQSLVAAPRKLSEHPRLGERLQEFEPREVRRLLVGNYEIRYEITNGTIFILRIWHTREKR
jgi:plasmid stabilization system protein ParE